MPPVFSKTRPLTIQPFSVPQSDFAFPTNKHLLITTPSRIVSWDDSGIHDLFTSSKAGIAAATESKDGSGILAVADKHTVVLHDTQRGKEKSWGLSPTEDEVRHLEYTKDSKNLFLTTTATNAIQCYSTQAQRLLSPPQILSSPAVVLAVSPTGHLMISAQGTPPVVFLKDLSKNSTATLLKPQASASGITIAAFHPERANIFLLAFDDGTLAVFDASRLRRGVGEEKYNDQSHTGKAEIGRKTQLHRAIHYKTEGRSRAINGAAFLPGQNLKTITVGIDGRCKLLDFSNGSNVLRTWHAEAPLTCVSVSTMPPIEDRKQQSSGRLKTSGTLIATGSQDGKVLIYDSLGLLQGVKQIGSAGERVIGVEWVNGASPKCVSTAAPLNGHRTQILSPLVNSSAKATKNRESKRSTPKHLSIHPALRPSTTNPIASTSSQTRRFTIHPDEAMNDSTVRHTPKAQGNYMVSAEAGEYLDLFSPVNPFAAERTRANREKSYSPTRTRPRISSQTFISTPKSTTDMAKSSLSRPPILLPTVDSHAPSSSSIHTGIKRSVQFRSPQSIAKGSPLKTERRRLQPASVRKQIIHRTDSREVVDTTVVSNARLLRELRQMGARTANAYTGGITKSYESRDPKRREVRPEQLQAPVRIKAIESSPLHPDVQVYGPGGRWPTDSVDEPSWSEEQQDDIWITSDEERHVSSRRIHGIERPAARQTSRSRMDSKGTVSTTQAPTRSPTVMSPVSAPKATDGITSADDYTTALSHASPDGAHSLASDDVKSLFPRTSSKTPKKSKSGVRETPKHRKTALQEIASNAAQSRRASDPWTKVKQLRGLPVGSTGVAEPRDHVAVDRVVPSPHARGEACDGCTANASKVRILEGEVAHMKGEILALRAMLRRNGIPTPAVPRR
jgi:WD40 repeat protein